MFRQLELLCQMGSLQVQMTLLVQNMSSLLLS